MFDRVSGGLGFSKEVFNSLDKIILQALAIIRTCGCEDGCPSCVGPGGEFGHGSKKETLNLLELLET
jgi:DEAD/DEAH box helicase domain-containing protein